MAKTRLLFVNHATTIGGGERSMLELARALGHTRYDITFALSGPGPLAKALAKAGERVYFYRAEPSLLNFHREAISPLSVAWWRHVGKVFRAARSLRSVIAAERSELIHTHSQKAHVFATLAVVGMDVPLIWHMRDVLVGRFARGIIDVLAAARAARVIAISNAVVEQFKLARGKATVVYNAVAPPEPLGPEFVARTKSAWGVPRDARVLGCVGQIAPWKGQHVFVEAAAALAPAFRDLYFVVIGSPLYGARAYYAELIRKVRRAGLAPRFRFLGQREDAARTIGAFDVLVHTPVKTEPFGRVIVEAMARGVPVVASRSGGAPEIMEDGREGFLVEVGHAGATAAATAFLLDDPLLAAEVGARGCETYKRRFTVERLCQEVELIYYDVLRPALPLRFQKSPVKAATSPAARGGLAKGSYPLSREEETVALKTGVKGPPQIL
ncbi:MAG: glycosyltransferase family 4 protein [bacterium]